LKNIKLGSVIRTAIDLVPAFPEAIDVIAKGIAKVSCEINGVARRLKGGKTVLKLKIGA
jgi:hypothetical protein